MRRLPTRVEHEEMEKLVTTHGKTRHALAHRPRDRLPYGIQRLMMGFTADGRAKLGLLRTPDRRFDRSYKEGYRYDS